MVQSRDEDQPAAAGFSVGIATSGMSLRRFLRHRFRADWLCSMLLSAVIPASMQEDGKRKIRRSLKCGGLIGSTA
jgi:hypothetical protein